MTIAGQSFDRWTPHQVAAAELACSRYDELGHIFRMGIVDSRLVAAQWRDSIVKCHEAAEPMLRAYRQDRGDDFWSHFDWLYQQAKAVAVP